MIMRHLLVLAASLISSTCSVDLSKLRPHADAQPDLTNLSDRDPSPHLDATPIDAQEDLSPCDVTPHLDATSDSNTPDLTPDLAPKSSIGSKCSSSPQCTSGFCTDNTCCNVAQCKDPCIPNGITTCTTYIGWTCSPYGTCRGY